MQSGCVFFEVWIEVLNFIYMNFGTQRFNIGKYFSRLSSLSAVSVYRLNDRGSIPDRGKGFSSSLCVQSSSEPYPASYPMGTGNPSPELKRGQGVTLTTLPHLLPRSIMSMSYTYSLPYGLQGV
jgi:hypothetical protein